MKTANGKSYDDPSNEIIRDNTYREASQRLSSLPGDNTRPSMRTQAGAKPGTIGGLLDRAKVEGAQGYAQTPLDAGQLGYNMKPTPGPMASGDPLDRAAGRPQPGDPMQRAMGRFGHLPPPPGSPLPPPPTNATGKGGTLGAVRQRYKAEAKNLGRDWIGQMSQSRGYGTPGQSAPGAPPTATGSGGSGGVGPLDAGGLGREQRPANESLIGSMLPAKYALAYSVGKDVLSYGFLGDTDARGRLGLPPQKPSRLASWQDRWSPEGNSLVYGPGTDVAPRHPIDTHGQINAWNVAGGAMGGSNPKGRGLDYVNEMPRDVRVVNQPPVGGPTPYGGTAGPEMPTAGAGPVSQGQPDYMHASQTQAGNPWFDSHQQAVNGLNVQTPQPIRKPQAP